MQEAKYVKAKLARVTDLEDFRIYKTTPDLDLGWLENRLFGAREETEQMAAGTAFHAILQDLDVAAEPDGRLGKEIASLAKGPYRFDFNCNAEIELPRLREVAFSRQYGNRWVTGHVDGVRGNKIIEYKTTESLDAQRYMESYQWRFYIDLSDCDEVLYQIFVIRPFGPPGNYSVKEAHHLRQFRYPDLHQDCERLVEEFDECLANAGW
jgi:hypothetical protein